MQLIVLLGIFPIFVKGYKKPLDSDDLFPLRKYYLVAERAVQFEILWKQRKDDYMSEMMEYIKKTDSTVPSTKSNKKQKVPPPPQPPSIWGILYTMFVSSFIPLGVFYFLAAVCLISAPIILNKLIAFIVDDTKTYAYGYGLSVSMFLVNMLNTILVGYFFQRVGTHAMIIRSTLTDVVHRKAMRLSNKERQSFDTGKITTIITSGM